MFRTKENVNADLNVRVKCDAAHYRDGRETRRECRPTFIHFKRPLRGDMILMKFSCLFGAQGHIGTRYVYLTNFQQVPNADYDTEKSLALFEKGGMIFYYLK